MLMVYASNVILSEGSVLRRWKRNWFVLYTDGMLKYFDSPDSHVAEEAFFITTKLLTLKTAHQVDNAFLAEDQSRTACTISLWLSG